LLTTLEQIVVTPGTQQALRIGFAVLPQAMVALLGGNEAA
jgi:hypothetical protein